MHFQEILTSARVIFFIDNTSVQAALVKGNTRSLASRSMLRKCVELDAEVGTSSWYARVPSPSNVADGPSRLDFSLVATLPSS
eukprot:3150194-Amphidinium_carterae.1